MATSSMCSGGADSHGRWRQTRALLAVLGFFAAAAAVAVAAEGDRSGRQSDEREYLIRLRFLGAQRFEAAKDEPKGAADKQPTPAESTGPVPLTDLEVLVTQGYGQQERKFGPFRTDEDGVAEVKLPVGFYALHLKSERELPFLPVEILWNGRNRRVPPGLNLSVKESRVEKWLDGERQDSGDAANAESGVPRINYTLLPACELMLRAVDVKTGKGLAGAEFFMENALGEDWAHPIEGANLGVPPVDDKADAASAANRTDDQGTFRRLVGANAGYKYGVTRSPAGYEPVDPGVEVEIDIPWGQWHAEHIFKFRRVR